MNRKEKLDKKFYIVLIACLLLIGGIVSMAIYKSHQHDMKSQERETKGTADIQAEENNHLEDEVPESNTSILIFEITNRDEYIEPILKQWSYMANQGLAKYVQSAELEVTKATCFETEMLNGETVFYFECNDQEQTTLELTYNHNDRVVEVKESDYSRGDMLEKARLIGGDSLLEEQE